MAKANFCPCLCLCRLLSSGKLAPYATPDLEGKEDSGGRHPGARGTLGGTNLVRAVKAASPEEVGTARAVAPTAATATTTRPWSHRGQCVCVSG